jgi:eukaryotic-like serine/threonine-protein kinase
MDVGQGTLPAGFQFGAYVIGSCIGRGGMARIYRAEHRVLHKPVALKVMESVLLERPDGRPRFLREGQAAAAVKHPNVVDITDVGVWQGRPYLVMELLEGEDLEQYLSRHKPLAEQDAARILIPIIAGLATAHAAGVIHRDLKPSNVFLARGPDGEVVPKLLDFGISKLANALRTLDPASTPLGELMGSPMYMSPEAVRGARDLTPQSDQYSLGVILYECITGRPPFYGDSLLSVLEAVAHGQFESPRRFRPELSTVLEVATLRAMSRDPGDRFPSVRELGRALCEAADQRTRLLWTPSFGVRDVPLQRNTASLGAPSFGLGTLRTGAPASGGFGSLGMGGSGTGSLGMGGSGSGSLRTGSPLSASFTGRSRPFPYWQLGLSALALVMLALASVAYFRMPTAPYAEGLAPAAAARGTSAVPASVGAAPSLPGGAAAAAGSGRFEARPPGHPPGVAEALAAQPPSPVLAEPSPAAAEPPADAPMARAQLGAETSSPQPRPAPRAVSSPAPRPLPRPPVSKPAPSRPIPDETEALRRVSPPEADEPAAALPGDADEVVFPVRAPAPSRPAPILGANQSPILD